MATALSQVRPASHLAKAPYRIAIVGYGTVGSALGRLLHDRGRDHSLKLTHVCNRQIARKVSRNLGPEVVWTESLLQVLQSDADVVVELMGGLDPAHDLIRGALKVGKSVVTANKQIMAQFGSELMQLARERRQYLGFGACVAGGVPVLAGLHDGLAGDRLVQIRGILNGTCNYILTRIEAGASFAEALAEAQQAGFAEADPSYDLDGQDAAAKLAILARIGLKLAIPLDQVSCHSIRSIAAIDFDYARDLGCTIRQVSTASAHHTGAYVAVEPALVPRDSALAHVSGSQNLVISSGEFGGETSFGGLGAGGDPTAVAVLSDVIQASACLVNQMGKVDHQPHESRNNGSEKPQRQYLRFVVRDRPGIIAAMAGVFSRYHINLDAILQKPGHCKSALPFVITLEPCGQSALQAALAEIERFDFLIEQPLRMPILN